MGCRRQEGSDCLKEYIARAVTQWWVKFAFAARSRTYPCDLMIYGYPACPSPRGTALLPSSGQLSGPLEWPNLYHGQAPSTYVVQGG